MAYLSRVKQSVRVHGPLDAFHKVDGALAKFLNQEIFLSNADSVLSRTCKLEWTLSFIGCCGSTSNLQVPSSLIARSTIRWTSLRTVFSSSSFLKVSNEWKFPGYQNSGWFVRIFVVSSPELTIACMSSDQIFDFVSLDILLCLLYESREIRDGYACLHQSGRFSHAEEMMWIYQTSVSQPFASPPAYASAVKRAFLRSCQMRSPSS